MSREKIKQVPDEWSSGSFSDGKGKVFFARREGGEFGMSDDNARRHTGIGGDSLVAGIARDDPGMWMTYYARENQRRGAIAVFGGELLQAGGVAINSGSGRDTMEEVSVAKTFVR